MRSQETDKTRLLNPIPKRESLYTPLPKSKGVVLLNPKRQVGVRVLTKSTSGRKK